MAWMVDRNEFKIDDNVIVEFRNLMTVWTGIIETIPMNQSAEDFLHFTERKLSIGDIILSNLLQNMSRSIDPETLLRDLSKTSSSLTVTFT
jgi:hypothetical protein